MAELLYRIGRFSARRHWTVIGAWLAVLVLTGVTYASFAGALSSSISLPDTPTTRVSGQLERDFEGTGGGNGTIVVESTDGSALTDDQQQDVLDLFDRIAAVDGVDEVTDPFATQQQVDDGAAQVADGRKQLNDGLAELIEAQGQITGGRAALEEQRRQARADGTLADVRAQLDAAEQQLDDGQAELDRQRAKIDEQAPQLDQGETLARLSSGFRTVSKDGSAAVANVVFAVAINEVAGRDQDRDRGPRRRRRHRRGRPLPVAGHRPDRPVDPRSGRGRRRRHRRDRPVPHARHGDRRRPAAGHRAARGRRRVPRVAVVLRSWSSSCPSRRCSA